MKTSMGLIQQASAGVARVRTGILLPLLMLVLTVAAAAQTVINYPGAIATHLKGINNAGTMVGFYWNSDGSEHSFIYDGQTYTPIVHQGSIWIEAGGINQDGDVVGFYGIAADNLIHGFLLTVGGKWTDLNIPGRFNVMPEGVNSNHTVIGCMHNPGTMHGWTMQNGALVSKSSAYEMYNGINDSGAIVGWKYYAPNTVVGFILTGSGETEFSHPNASDTEPWGINDYGDVVGRYGPNNGRHGFLLKDGNFTSIDILGAKATVAMGINDGGAIVGFFIDANGKHHGFIR